MRHLVGRKYFSLFFRGQTDKSPFQIQITASVRDRPLRATWATITAQTLLAAAVREPKLLFVTERGSSKSIWRLSGLFIILFCRKVHAIHHGVHLCPTFLVAE